jgi:hypothetical protein
VKKCTMEGLNVDMPPRTNPTNVPSRLAATLRLSCRQVRVHYHSQAAYDRCLANTKVRHILPAPHSPYWGTARRQPATSSPRSISPRMSRCPGHSRRKRYRVRLPLRGATTAPLLDHTLVPMKTDVHRHHSACGESSLAPAFCELRLPVVSPPYASVLPTSEKT